MLNRGLTVLKSSSTEKKLDKKNKDKIVQTYFQEKTANLYIKKILNDPNKEFLTNRDLDALKESYDKAHDIRKFEIELYWKRTAYVWTLIASLITVTGVLLAAYYRLPTDSGGSNALLGLVASVAILGVLITIISSKIIRGGEYWQKNWEYHVSLLEPLFSGRIYSTLVNKKLKRHSISKLNSILYFLFLGVWLLLAEGIYFVVFPDTNKNNFFILLASFSTLVYITSYLIDLWTYRKPEKTQLSIAHWQVELQEKTTAISVESNKKNTSLNNTIRKIYFHTSSILKLTLLLIWIMISMSFLYYIHYK
ncbi:hypothetical protein [Enterobacter hormaechei]|uniref:RipA family octameric membrane protein n=1 Tax=Enterobacter hormaechei TaxID=158836 RepID=UPI00193E4625